MFFLVSHTFSLHYNFSETAFTLSEIGEGLSAKAFLASSSKFSGPVVLKISNDNTTDHLVRTEGHIMQVCARCHLTTTRISILSTFPRTLAHSPAAWDDPVWSWSISKAETSLNLN